MSVPTKKSNKKTAEESVEAPLELPSPVEKSPPAFPVVGIGASAGGLAAFEAFFSGLPAVTEPGMAFVLVQHLAPDHKSLLTDLIRRCTRMQVFEVDDGMVVQRNCVYIIPPNHDMAFLNGTLHLLEPSAPRGQRLPIDFFFRSLAHDQCECAIGIVLSGTGSDGTLGVRAIKGEGGMVMAQTPESCDFDGMPRSVIATGLTDYVLPPAEMAAQLIAYAAHAFGKLPRTATVDTPKTENALKKIFILLRAQTGHDFSHYKPSTINRRIERRMAVHQIEDLGSYVKYLQLTPSEIEALFRDLLIGVTNFFRDPEVFEVLEREIIPKLFADKPPGAVVRVWSTGCSTGEEAYSIAILLQERMEALKKNYTVQVFATDIDSRAITVARAGVYPASIAADITPERLARFFSAEPDGSAFRVHKSIRDMLIFSEQDVIKDPPFSKLDLISCRNLMIYLGTLLQKKLIPLFHYALKPSGILLLGTSEGVSDFIEMFSVLDRKAKIFQRKEDYQATYAITARSLPLTSSLELATSPGSKKMAFPVKLPLRELTEQALLQQLAPTGALVNWHGDILYLHGRTGMYLEPAPGEVGTSNILKMAREGLRHDLTLALQKSIGSKEVVHYSGLRVKTNGHYTLVNLTVCPVSAVQAAAQHVSTSPESHLYLVILEDMSALSPELLQTPALPAGAEEVNPNSDAEARIAMLKQELRAKDEYLQSTHEELESSNEELKSSNEEMQSVNEELQSTNEELETSKEELQSVNEELATVNNELQTKVADLSRANNDMNNLLAGNGIGTVFVDFQLRILRFTPAASSIINLILSDVGRPVAHIVSNLVGYDSLVADTKAVLDTLILKEITVQTTAGHWYTMRIQPYRTLDNVIEGAVISFIDITETVRTRDALNKANELLRLAVVVRDAHDAITMQDLQGRILAWNPGAIRMYGWSEAEALLMNVRDRIPQKAQEEALATLTRLCKAEILEPYRSERITKRGETIAVSITSTALLNDAGEMYAIATTERAIG
jgi:two-component system CheB/CheR fusion protein